MTPKTPSAGYVEAWDVESLSEPGKTYVVSRRKTGELACSCPAWKFHKAPKPDCKHIRALAGELGAEAMRYIPDVVKTTPIPISRPTTTTQPLVTVSFDGIVVGILTRAQADQFRANLKKPVQPDVVVSGDFRIKRKFRLED